MDKQDRDNLLFSLIQNYVFEKNNCVVYNREISPSLSYATGKLIGALTALNLDMVENDDSIIIMTRNKNKQVLKYDINYST